MDIRLVCSDIDGTLLQYGKKELETFIRTAREEGRLQALVWLMKEKNDRYGYEDREYDL